MEITYENRNGDIYYLHGGETKTGKPKYFFSKKDEGNLLEKIPGGYEVYENINAQVFIRKIQPKIITDDEFALIKWCLDKCTHIPSWQVEVKKKTVIVHTSDDSEDHSDDEDFINAFGADLYALKKDVIDNVFRRSIRYTPMLKFTLANPVNRMFDVERYCFRGEGEWIPIDYSKDLETLAKEYCPYLSTEEFYELY